MTQNMVADTDKFGRQPNKYAPEEAANTAGALAVMAMEVGLPVGNMTIRTDAEGNAVLESDLLDSLRACVAQSDKLGITPTDLLVKYIRVLMAVLASRDADCTDASAISNVLGAHILASILPAALTSDLAGAHSERAELMRHYLNLQYRDASHVMEAKASYVQCVVTALLTFHSITGEQIERLITFHQPPPKIVEPAACGTKRRKSATAN